ncbi:Glycosyl transferase, group 1 [Pseudooceanicola batsensis HTCC2597]|uniref:Glycosyl transferase, group 1 n=1 Tax=Pseudooceanicola batsensis (strain ATCC BAA-863 / DSM 15984 / KCTC 12145 / HTCC2597) TaxID=252305 RepID=A3TW01_PSEBH|nr:glycosyltransferase family 1 protein [Pseudooceanicola batsensis]EAQ03797.1 Glycosyl transferase, group 1 [Pseudooceanicola batsensis HTCC2597]
MSKPVFYDLTEILYLSGSSPFYYGIARVVAEAAREIFLLDRGVRFVAYSQAHDTFMEIFPGRDETGDVDLNVPNARLLKFVRATGGKPRAIRHVQPLLLPPFLAYQRLRWFRTGVDIRPVDMSGGIFLSCARPKLMIHAVDSIRAKHPGCEVHALLHDMIPLYVEKHDRDTRFASSFRIDNNYLIERADHIITNSQFTADDIMSFVEQGLLIQPRKMTAVRLPHECRAGTDQPVISLPERPYVLMVGTSLGRKNLDVVLDAMCLVLERGKTPPLLVLAGRKRKRTLELLETPRMAEVAKHVLHVDRPNQTDLERLYREALALVLPSEIEGWGLPAAEALWNGIPPFCSDIPVLREVCGDLGVYFDLRDAEALSGHLVRLKEEPGWRAGLVDRIEANSGSLRTWNQFATELLDRAVAP